jgi:phenylacetate-CoA ligase
MLAEGSMKLDMSTYEPFGLEAIEIASRDEIAALQTQRVKHALQNVYEKVPAYRKKFDGAGVSPADFRRLEDLQKFPFTTKQDLRENYPFGMFAVPKEKIVRVHASSGTTGRPPWSAIRETTSIHGPIWLRAPSAPLAPGPAC